MINSDIDLSFLKIYKLDPVFLLFLQLSEHLYELNFMLTVWAY